MSGKNAPPPALVYFQFRMYHYKIDSHVFSILDVSPIKIRTVKSQALGLYKLRSLVIYIGIIHA